MEDGNLLLVNLDDRSIGRIWWVAAAAATDAAPWPLLVEAVGFDMLML